MPNANDRKIIEKLSKASAMELNNHELESILENELNKPAEEIDTKLIEDLMDILQPEELSAKQQKIIWKNIQKKLSSKNNRHRLVRRLTAIAALLVLLFGFTLAPANAFHWQFLRRLLKPVAETFGIYLNYFDEAPVEAPTAHQYGVSEDEAVPVMYDNLDDIPDTYDGYAIKPGWIPEGFTFVQASSYSEVHLQKYAIQYCCEQKELNITIAIHTDQETIAKYEFERITDEPEERLIGSTMVTFYNNYRSEDVPQHVSWVVNNAHYSIQGMVSADEIEQMIMLYRQTFNK